jgi:DNA-directed RNA polymerase delta subunit
MNTGVPISKRELESMKIAMLMLYNDLIIDCSFISFT